MCEYLKKLIPEKIEDPTSLEDMGWNACCQHIMENIAAFQRAHIECPESKVLLVSDYCECS